MIPVQVFERTCVVPLPLEETFAFFSDPKNLEALTPKWMRFRLVEAPGRLEVGARLRYRLSPFGVPTYWLAEISDWRPPHSFSDVQLEGPYRVWEHTHELAESGSGTEVRDRVRYRLRGGPLGAFADRTGHRAFLSRLFDYRTKRLAELLTVPR